MLKYFKSANATATSHRFHSFPHSRSATFHRPDKHEFFDRSIESDTRYEFRDTERELYERQVEFERELERQKYVCFTRSFSGMVSN